MKGWMLPIARTDPPPPFPRSRYKEFYLGYITDDGFSSSEYTVTRLS